MPRISPSRYMLPFRHAPLEIALHNVQRRLRPADTHARAQFSRRNSSRHLTQRYKPVFRFFDPVRIELQAIIDLQASPTGRTRTLPCVCCAISWVSKPHEPSGSSTACRTLRCSSARSRCCSSSAARRAALNATQSQEIDHLASFTHMADLATIPAVVTALFEGQTLTSQITT